MTRFVRKPNWLVCFHPYSLDEGGVGKPIYREVFCASHESAKQAAISLSRLIRGKDETFQNYKRDSFRIHGKGFGYRVFIRSTRAPFKEYALNEFKKEFC